MMAIRDEDIVRIEDKAYFYSEAIIIILSSEK